MSSEVIKNQEITNQPSASVILPYILHTAELLLFFSSLCPRSHRRMKSNKANVSFHLQTECVTPLSYTVYI